MKNVMAIAAGMSDGLGLGANARSALLTRGLAELARLLAALGGQAQTLMSLAGIGDVILTCTTDQSRNRRFGLLIGEGRSTDEAINQIGQVVEGYYNVAQLYQLSQRYSVDMPIVAAVHAVLQGHQSPSVAAAALMARQVQGRWG
jgi:glycerol-3-phosphate dehydrogenase (NAD(P)+)